ncbi:hypothetical protein [Streptomyces sp. FIT100]|nr:hypothetical protein [Streptomyces sp. FIT100]UUN30178.1 hypothetical protein KK483_30325 [Streptomyces sp. FIT100]
MDDTAGANIADVLAQGHRGEQSLQSYAQDVRDTTRDVRRGDTALR